MNACSMATRSLALTLLVPGIAGWHCESVFVFPSLSIEGISILFVPCCPPCLGCQHRKREGIECVCFWAMVLLDEYIGGNVDEIPEALAENAQRTHTQIRSSQRRW